MFEDFFSFLALVCTLRLKAREREGKSKQTLEHELLKTEAMRESKESEERERESKESEEREENVCTAIENQEGQREADMKAPSPEIEHLKMSIKG